VILILGGTGEAHRLASALERPFTLSLAGATRRPQPRPYPLRSGGFGGVEGLAAYLRAKNIAALIDATHPFAARISRNAVAAARATSTPLLRLERPAWEPQPDWHVVPDIAAAASVLPPQARAFLTVGSQHLASFAARKDIWCLTRAIEPPAQPPRGEVLLQRPPFTPAAETVLMRHHAITHLVSKNAGGAQTRAKLDAAAALALPVIMVARPELPLAETAGTIKDALEWIRHNAGRQGK